MKGMQKIKRGTGFRGCAEYLLDHDGGRVIGGNMTGSDPRALAREFAVSRQLRPDIEKPVWHNSLRLPADERVDVDDLKWLQIADEYMRAMGFSDQHQRVYVRHEPDHIHILASRVSIGGQVYLGRNENLRSTAIISRLEQVHGLTVTKGPEKGSDGKIKAPDVRRIKVNERKMYERREEEPPREQLQWLVSEAAQGKPTASEFVTRLREQGVSVRANASQNTGRLAGFSFALDGVAFTGKQLGEKFTWARLEKSGVSYDPTRDLDTLLLRNKEQRDQQHEIKTPPLSPPAHAPAMPEQRPLPRNWLADVPRPRVEKKQEPEKKKERNYLEEATQHCISEEKIQRCLMLENDNSRNEEYMQAISELSDEETKMLFDEMQRRNEEEMEKNMQGFEEKSSKSKIDWSL
jgi:hypothetical protein